MFCRIVQRTWNRHMIPYRDSLMDSLKWRTHIWFSCVYSSSVADDYNIGNISSSELPRHKKKVISRALEVYLNDVQSHSKTMARERAEYELGKRHLANIMGLDPQTITQWDIDKAIEYLFPSGLSDGKALPLMKPPEEISPKIHHIDFDGEGRPRDLLFYTLSPNFYRLLSDVGWKIEALLSKQRMSSEEIELSDDNKIWLVGSVWMAKDALIEKLGEKISEEMYTHLIVALDFLVTLPHSYEERDFIRMYRKSVVGEARDALFGPQFTFPIPPVTLMENGLRKTNSEVRVKETVGEVEVIDGTGDQYTVDGHGIDLFRSIQAREIFLAPLVVTDLLGRVNIIAKIVQGPGGASVIPRLVRHGVALGIAALYPEHFGKLRLGQLSL